MISRYFVHAGRMIHYGAPGDSYHAANCANPEAAVKLLNDAQWLNDAKRRYTAAARKIATAECLPEFAWIDPDYTP